MTLDTAMAQAYHSARQKTEGGDLHRCYLDALEILREADLHKKSFGRRLLSRMRSDPDFEAGAAELLAAFMRRDPAGQILKETQVEGPAAGDGVQSIRDDQSLGDPAPAETERAGHEIPAAHRSHAGAASRSGHSKRDDQLGVVRSLATPSLSDEGARDRLCGDSQAATVARDRFQPGHAKRLGMSPALARQRYLDTIRINGQALRDVTPDEALRWSEARRLDASRVERICFGLHPEQRIGDQISDDEAERRADQDATGSTGRPVGGGPIHW